MPQSDVITGISPIDNIAIQKDTEQRLGDVFGGPTNFNPASNFQVPKGIAGTVEPGQNINLDKNSYEYQEAFYQKLLQDTAKKYPDTFKQLPELQLPQSETRRYIDEAYGFRPGVDNEDFYSTTQGPVKEFFKSVLGRLPLLTLSKLGTGVGYLAGLANPVNWFNKNYISSASDNFIAKAFTELEDNVKNDWLPIYQKAAARDMGFFDRALGGDQTFWYGDVVDAAAFMASAYVPAAIVSKLGLGAKLLTGIGMEADQALASTGTYLQRMGQYGVRNLDMGLTTAVNTASESMFEARQIKDDLTQKLKDTGKYTDQEIEDMVGSKMKNSFLSNLAALSFSNAWESNLFFHALNRGKKLSSEAIKLGETSLIEEYALPAAKGKFGRFLNSPIGFYGKKSLQGIGVEGFYEENIQQAIQQYNESTVENRPNTLLGYMGGVLERMYNQTIDAFQGKDKDTAMNIGVGALIGGFFGTSMSAISGERKEERTNSEKALAAINDARNNWLKVGDIYSVGPDGKVKTDSAKAAAIFINQNIQAEKLNIANAITDPTTLEIAKKQLFAPLVSSHIQNGSLNQLLKQLDDLKTATPESLMKLGFNPENNTLEKINEYKDYAKKLDEIRGMVNKIRPSKDDPQGFISHYRNNLYDIAARRIANEYEINHLSNKISDINSRIGAHDTSDDLVYAANSLLFKSKIQEENLRTASPDTKHVYEDRLGKYEKEHNQLIKDNQETFDSLKKDSQGMYSFKNDEKKNHPLTKELSESLIKKIILENSNDVLLDQYNDLIDNRDNSRNVYNKQIESLEKFVEEIKKKKEQEVKEQKKTETVPTATTPAATETAPVTTTPQEIDPKQIVRDKILALRFEMSKKLEEPGLTEPQKTEIRKSYLSQIRDLSFAKIVEKPEEEQKTNFEKLKQSIPEGKKIDVQVSSDLHSQIREARIKGEISEAGEITLHGLLDKKDITGTIFDRPEDIETNKEDVEKEIDEPNPFEIDSSDNTDENTLLGKNSEEYDPDTETVEEPTELEDRSASLVAYSTSNKTVTQQEEKPGILDEDPYKIFKQGLLSHFEQNPELFKEFSGKIIKDNLSLPHSEETMVQIRSGNFGSVLVITDNSGNLVYFDKNYNKSNNPAEGYQLAVYSFSDTYWKNTAEQRAQIASVRSGLTVDQWIAHYDSEARQQDLARQLNDQGKEVMVDLGNIVPGQLKRSFTYLPATSFLDPKLEAELYIPPAPLMAFDPNNPKATTYSFVGNKKLINGALYASVKDPYSKDTNYIRLIPNKLSEVPELLSSVSNLLNHKYLDESEADQVIDYLKEVLFLGKSKRPTLISKQLEKHWEIHFIQEGKVIPNEVALDYIGQQRFNIIKNLVDRPELYPHYDIKDGKLNLQDREDYTTFVISNSVTKQLPLRTSEGNRFVAINSYMTFKFRDSEDSMKADLVSTDDMRPGERAKEFKEDEIGVWRHGETNEDNQSKSSGNNEIPLNQEGVKNATSIGEFWKNHGINGKVYSSTINRAFQTAKIAAEVAGIKEVIGSDLLKTWDIGKFASIPSDQFDEKHYVLHPDEKIEGGESFNQFVDRMIKARDYFSKIATPKDAIISHSRSIRVWDALKLNNGLRNDNFVEKYLNLSTEYSFTSFAKDEGPYNNATVVNPRFKRITLDAIRTTENRPFITSEEIAKVNQMFGEDVATLVDQISNSNVVAQWTTSGIKLYRDAKQGDGYHEAWHHFSQIYLNEREKRAMYDEARKKNINFRTRDNRDLNSKTASDFDLEEMVADDFRDYVLSDGRSRLVDRPQRNNIFRKILDFLKKFFFGEINLSKLYDDLYRGNLNEYIPSINNARWGKLNAQTINQKGDEIFDAQKSAYYRNVLDYFMGKHLRLKGYDPGELSKDKNKTDAIYKNMRADLVENHYHVILDKVEAGTSTPQEEALAEDLFQLLYNYEDFIQFHKATSKLHLNIPYELAVSEDINESDDTSLDTELGGEDFEIEEEDESETEPIDGESTQPEYDRSGNEQSPWQAAPIQTRSLIRMLPEIDPETKQEKLDINGFPKLNDYAKTWNNLTIELSNMNKYEEMYNKLNDKEVQRKIPEILVLLQHLPDPYKSHTAAEIETIINFRKSFDRSYIGIFSGKTTKNGNFWFNEETKRNKDLIKRLWTANFLNKSASDENLLNERILIDGDTGKNYLNPEVTLNYNTSTPKGKENLMHLLGFDLTERAKKNTFYVKDMSQHLANIQNNINERHKNGQKIFNPVYDLRKDLKTKDDDTLAIGLAATIDAIVELESRYSEEVPSMSYRTAEGTMIYGLSLNHTLSIFSNKLNKAGHYDEIRNDPSTQHLDFTNNPYVRGSIFLQHMFNTESKNPDVRGRRSSNRIIVGNYNGPKYENEDDTTTGYSTTSLNVRQKIVFDMNSLLSSGAIDIMRTESSKTSYFVKMNSYPNSIGTDKSSLYLPVGAGQLSSSFRNGQLMKIMIDNYLRDELIRMKTADDVEVYKTDPELLTAAKGFNLFSNILTLAGGSQNLKNSLKEDIEKMSPEDAIQKHRQDIEGAIDNFFIDQYNSFVRGLNNNNITADNLAKSLLPNTTFPQKIRTFLVNDLILNIEYTKLFNGDTIYQAHYKDYFKRSKGDISTGLTPITDDSFARYMKQGEDNTFSGFIKSDWKNDYKTVQTINIMDDVRKSNYVSLWKENLKKTNPELSESEIDNLLGKYDKVNVADGQGHITLDFYRQFLKSIGNWSDSQEKQYQLELSRYRLDHADFNENYNNEMRQMDRTFLQQNPQTYAYFPPIKMQYNGPIKAKGTFASVMDKFSVAPLIPSIIKGTPLEDLNFQMIKKGVGYSKFLSGTKKYKHPSIEMYNQDGYKEINLDSHEPAVHFLTYLKEQINTKNAIKDESIFGSQVRKLIEANIFDRGEASEEAMSRHKIYLGLLAQLKEIGKQELYKDLGIKEMPGTEASGGIAYLAIGDIEKFVATLQDQVDKRELNDNIRNYIQVNDRGFAVIDPTTTLKLLYPLESSLNRKSIQDLIMGVIDRRLRRHKLNGDQLFQISSSGFQSKDFKYKNATPEEINKYGTNGLRFYHLGEDGKTVAAQCKVGLNGGYEKLLNKQHPDGKKIGTLERLNTLLKDEKWVNDNRKKITIIGYRIPTQGYNSMEFMEIAEFLPGHIGSSIIVPTEITAKSGSDFDIDKLPIFRASLDDEGNLISGESKEAIGNKLIDLFKEILSDPKNFKQLIKPNDTELIHGIVDQVAVSLGKRKQSEVDKPEGYKGTQIYRYQTNIRKFESLLSAQRLLAVFAVSNTFTTLLQQAGIKTNDRYGITNGPTRLIKLFLLSPKERGQVLKEGKIDISNKYDVEGNLKQDYTSQLINATVDAPSDDFFGYSNISYENIGVLGYLMNQGVPFERAFWFLHQPVLMHYYQELKQRKKYEKISEIQARILGNLRDKTYNKLLDYETTKLDYNAFHRDINVILNDPASQNTFLSVDVLKKTTKKQGEIPHWLADERAKRFNALVFAYFISLKEQSNLFNNFRQLLNFDTKKTTSPVYAWQQYVAIRNLSANKLFNNEDVKKMSTLTTISSFDNKQLIAQIGVTLMPSAFNPTFMKMAAIKISRDTDYKTKVFKKRYIANYENQWVEYIVKSLGKVGDKSIQSYSKYLLEGKNNIARRFNQLITQYPQLKENYNFVNRIRPNFSNNDKVKKSNVEVHRLFENNQDDQNQYIQEFRNLINFSDPNYSTKQQLEIRNFFKDLAITAFVQSGFSKSNISFQELVPYEFLADIFKNAMVNFNKYVARDSELMKKYVDEFNQQFNRNERNLLQPWRGKDYFLSAHISEAIRKKTNKEEIDKSQVNLESEKPEILPNKVDEETPPWEESNIDVDQPIKSERDTDTDINGDSIMFTEEQTTGYRNRTIKNANADATIAIAIDFNSAGEKLTKSSVLNQNKKYIPVDANVLIVTNDLVNNIVDELNSINAKTLNVAGNGIYTMKHKYTQEQVDKFTYDLLSKVLHSPNLITKIESIRTGGQTGFDEAGAKAGAKLGIPTFILSPKGYTFRNTEGKDISNELEFKKRFLTDEQYQQLLKNCRG